MKAAGQICSLVESILSVSKGSLSHAGLVSGAVVSVSLQPFDVVRTRMQGDAANSIMQGSWRTLRTVIAESGPRSGPF